MQYADKFTHVLTSVWQRADDETFTKVRARRGRIRNDVDAMVRPGGYPGDVVAHRGQ